MFGKSIRFRFLLWLAFLLVAVLSGFGFTAFRLHTANQLRLIDEELERRVSTLSLDVRASARPGGLFRGPPGPRNDRPVIPGEEMFRPRDLPPRKDFQKVLPEDLES